MLIYNKNESRKKSGNPKSVKILLSLCFYIVTYSYNKVYQSIRVKILSY